MLNIRRSLTAALVGLCVAFMTACQSNDSTQAAGASQPKGIWEKLTRPPEKITVPAGTSLEVVLSDTLSSGSNRSGDSFAATLAAPIVVNDRVVVPQGARVAGRVVAAQSSGHLQTPPELALTLTSLEFAGNNYDLTTSTYARRGVSHKKHNAAWIGGAAAGGALLGALAGGGKGAAIGAGVGAGGGTAAAYATGKKDIVLPSETVIRFGLREPVVITKQG